jgi:hypothetical protein
MLVDFALIMVTETKTYVVGTTTICNYKIITRCALAAIDISIWHLPFHTFACNTARAAKLNPIITSETVNVMDTLSHQRNRTSIYLLLKQG